MKKYTLFLFVSAFILLGSLGFNNSASAENCAPTEKYNTRDGTLCPNFGGGGNSSAPFQTISVNSKEYDRSIVRSIQKILKDEDYSIGKINGVYGKRTARAVKEFQEDNELPITGAVDSETLRVLKTFGIVFPTVPNVSQPSAYITGVLRASTDCPSRVSCPTAIVPGSRLVISGTNLFSNALIDNPSDDPFIYIDGSTRIKPESFGSSLGIPEITFYLPANITNGFHNVQVYSPRNGTSNVYSINVVNTSSNLITVTEPNGEYPVGSTITIRYSTVGLGNSPINIDLVNQFGTEVQNIARNTPNLGVYTFIASRSLVGTRWMVKVSSGTAVAHGPDLIITDASTTQSSATASSSEIIGSQSTYNAGQTIKFSVRGVFDKGKVGSPNGVIATPALGFHVQANMYDASNKNAVSVNGVYQSFNATYDSFSSVWDVTMTAPSDNSKMYTIETYFYCSNSSLGCSNGQINKSFNFTLPGYSAQSSITTVKNSTFAGGSILSGTIDQKIGSFPLTAPNTDNVNLTSVTIKTQPFGSAFSASVFRNMRVKIYGVQYGVTRGIVENTINTTFNFGNTFVIPANSTVTVDVHADILSYDATSPISLSPATQLTGCTGAGTSSGNSINCSSVPVNGQNLTFAQSSIVVSRNPGYANQTFTAGTANAKLGSFQILASSLEDMNVYLVNVNLSADEAKAVTNLYLRDSSSGASIGGTKLVPVGSNSYSVNLFVPKNSTKTIDIYGDISSNATSGVWNATVSGSGVGASTGQSVNFGGSDTTLQTIQISSNSTTTPAQLSATLSPVSPSAVDFIRGNASQTIATFKLSTSGSPVNISGMRLVCQGCASPEFYSKDLDNVKLFDGSTQIGPTVTNVSPYIDFSFGHDGAGGFNIPANTTKTLTVKADIVSASKAFPTKISFYTELRSITAVSGPSNSAVSVSGLPIYGRTNYISPFTH